MLKNFWNDEAGAAFSAEIVLVVTILVIGMVVGLAAVRDSVVSELADVAQAIANIDQSYSYHGIVGHRAYTYGATFADAKDFCDGTDGTSDAGQSSKCVSMLYNVGSEGAQPAP
jgi:Flp pilus assembly pilin Flp